MSPLRADEGPINEAALAQNGSNAYWSIGIQTPIYRMLELNIRVSGGVNLVA